MGELQLKHTAYLDLEAMQLVAKLRKQNPRLADLAARLYACLRSK